MAKQKIQKLANVVAKAWNGKYILVVVHAFIGRDDPHSTEIFHTLSLHHEGRALDLTLGRKDENGNLVTILRDPDLDVKLKELASLARTGELKFNYAMISSHHIHVSTRRRLVMY